MQTLPVWPVAHWPFVAPQLGDNEVHVLSIGLDVDTGAMHELTACVTQQEREQARKYHHPRDRDRFLTARARLRQILGAYTGIAPARLRFVAGPQGKPALADPGAAQSLQFNLSHSEHRALLGLVHHRDIGVDLELQRDVPECEDIVRSRFASGEIAQWLATSAEQRTDAFFSCWTRKEACVKALGGGLSMDLRAFEVSIDPKLSVCSLHIAGSSALANQWTLWGLQPCTGFRAAVAVGGKGLALRLIDLV